MRVVAVELVHVSDPVCPFVAWVPVCDWRCLVQALAPAPAHQTLTNISPFNHPPPKTILFSIQRPDAELKASFKPVPMYGEEPSITIVSEDVEGTCYLRTKWKRAADLPLHTVNLPLPLFASFLSSCFHSCHELTTTIKSSGLPSHSTSAG